MLTMLALFCGILCVGMFINSLIRKGKIGVLSSGDMQKYSFIANKKSKERTEEEKEFYLQNQEAYLSLKFSIICLVSAIVLALIDFIK